MKSETSIPATQSVILVSEPYPDSGTARRVTLLFVVAFVLLLAIGAAWYWFCLLFITTMATLAAVTWKAFVELGQGIVREELRLCGIVLLTRSKTSLSAFEAVVVQHIKGGPEDNRDDWRVGLQHCSGRRIWMRYYERNVPWRSDPEDGAGSFAIALAEKTKLPIQDIDPPDAGQWFRRVKLRWPRRGSA